MTIEHLENNKVNQKIYFKDSVMHIKTRS